MPIVEPVAIEEPEAEPEATPEPSGPVEPAKTIAELFPESESNEIVEEPQIEPEQPSPSQE